MDLENQNADSVLGKYISSKYVLYQDDMFTMKGHPKQQMSFTS